jgi:hypothetical protein
LADWAIRWLGQWDSIIEIHQWKSSEDNEIIIEKATIFPCGETKVKKKMGMLKR